MSDAKKAGSASEDPPKAKEQIVERGSQSSTEVDSEHLQASAAGSEDPSPQKESSGPETPVKKNESEVSGSILKTILTSPLATPAKSEKACPATPVKNEGKCDSPRLRHALTRPLKTPEKTPQEETLALHEIVTSKKVQIQPSSPTKAMRSLQLSSPVKPNVSSSAQQAGLSQEQDSQLVGSRSRAKSAAAAFESPYNTRSKTKRIRDKEQRSASEE